MLQRLRGRRRNGERGASLVEFAILAPLLITLLLGIVEFGWVFGQHLSVRHGAREGARITAVNWGNNAAIGTEVCNRIDLVTGFTMTITGNPDLVAPAGTYNPGDRVTVQITAPATQLTGFFNAVMPTNLTSTVSISVEQVPNSWTAGGPPTNHTCP